MMLNKILYGLARLLIVAPLILILSKGDLPLSNFEWRVIIAVAYVFILVTNFGILRLYNAIVNNTLNLIKLNKYLDNFSKHITALVQSLTKLNGSLSNTLHGIKTSNEDFTKNVGEFFQKIRNRE